MVWRIASVLLALLLFECFFFLLWEGGSYAEDTVRMSPTKGGSCSDCANRGDKIEESVDIPLTTSFTQAGSAKTSSVYSRGRLCCSMLAFAGFLGRTVAECGRVVCEIGGGGVDRMWQCLVSKGSFALCARRLRVVDKRSRGRVCLGERRGREEWWSVE